MCIDEAAWGAGDGTGAGHNRDFANFPASPVSCLGDGGTGCHGSAHGSENVSFLAPAGGPSQAMTDFCYECHDADGPSSHNIVAQFATATNYQASGDGGAPINQRHDISALDQAYSSAAVSCADCHSPHTDNATNPVSDPDTGLALNTYNIANSYTDDGHNFTYDAGGNLDPVNPEGSAGGFSEPDYIQFCLTCHDGAGNAPAGVTMSSSMVDIATAYVAKDQHGQKEGNSGSKTSKGGKKLPWVTASDDAADNDPTAPYAAMNCNTCHGAHGSENIFNLRSSINVAGVDLTVGSTGSGGLTDPSYFGQTTYTLPLNGGSQELFYWGAWCSFCHKMNGHPGVTEATTCNGGHVHGGGNF
jgi:predicted CXXCH cytochrome family protein